MKNNSLPKQFISAGFILALLSTSVLGLLPIFQPPITSIVDVPKNETASGLNVTTFDTLVGTVTVNLPDDLAAGDTISGTVIAEVKKQTLPKDEINDQPSTDQAKAMDELRGYVVEVADQATPVKKPDGNLIDFCKAPGEKVNSNIIDVCKTWSVPPTTSSIPVVLKNAAGTVLGKARVPVAPRAEIAKAMIPGKNSEVYSTPAFGQAGKPISIKGQMGNFEDMAINIGNQTARFLASSPRKMTVESPRDVKGLSDIEIRYKGKSVAKCVYRSIGVRLSAEKLNLMKGEQTSLAVTLAGLIGLLSPVSVQLTNKSPGTISMSGGDAQLLDINPADVNGDTYTTKLVLTGIQAGGFVISAVVETGKASPEPGGCSPGPSTQSDPDGVKAVSIPGKAVGPSDDPKAFPIPGKAAGPPDDPGTDDDRPRPPQRANFRVTLNGFTADSVTNHGILQRPDQITFNPEILIVDSSGAVGVRLHGGGTNTIGTTGVSSMRGGSSQPYGGFLANDGFPTQVRPWIRTVPFSLGAPATIPPTVYFEGELTAGPAASTVVIVPTIWAIDGRDDLDLRGSYLREMERARAGMGTAARSEPTVGESGYLRSGSSMGIRNTMSLAAGVPQNRPIGMNPIAGGQFGFTPQVMVLTFESARRIAHTDFGLGQGIISVLYKDDPRFGGTYTLYFQIEEFPPTPDPCPPDVSTRFTGQGLGSQAFFTMDISATDCRRTVRIIRFPGIDEDLTEMDQKSRAMRVYGHTTVSMVNTAPGTFDPVTRMLRIPITLSIGITSTHRGESFGEVISGELVGLVNEAIVIFEFSGGRRYFTEIRGSFRRRPW